jgi:para-nitrobenzyl esterase
LEDIVEGGTFPKLDLIIGSNRNESLMYLPEGARLEDYLEGFFPVESWDEIKRLLGADLSELAKMDRLRSAVQYTCPSLTIASAAHNAGGSAYVYRFDRVREGFEPIGAYHGAELPYVFDRHDPWLPTSDVDRKITAAMVDYWIAFLTSDPRPDLPSISANSSRMGEKGEVTDRAELEAVTAESVMGEALHGRGTRGQMVKGQMVKGQALKAQVQPKVSWPAWSSSQQSLVVSNEVTVQAHPDAELCEFLNAIQATSARH